MTYINIFGIKNNNINIINDVQIKNKFGCVFNKYFI